MIAIYFMSCTPLLEIHFITFSEDDKHYLSNDFFASWIWTRTL